LFPGFADAYNVIQGKNITLSPNDTAVVITEEDGTQLFLPENAEMSDRALALVEIYNALVRDKLGHEKYQGFTQPFVDKMKSRVK
jgi:hypothetical protein